MLTWEGVIAVEGKPTVDGRLIMHDALDWGTPIAIYGLGEGDDWDNVLIGIADRVWREPNGEIRAVCQIDSGVSVDALGIDVGTTCIESVDGVQVITSGMIRVIRVYLDSSIEPSWPEARLRRV